MRRKKKERIRKEMKLKNRSRRMTRMSRAEFKDRTTILQISSQDLTIRKMRRKKMEAMKEKERRWRKKLSLMQKMVAMMLLVNGRIQRKQRKKQPTSRKEKKRRNQRKRKKMSQQMENKKKRSSSKILAMPGERASEARVYCLPGARQRCPSA
jgi:hypothetical protein